MTLSLNKQGNDIWKEEFKRLEITGIINSLSGCFFRLGHVGLDQIEKQYYLLLGNVYFEKLYGVR
jgi:uncharacterized membrane protein YesL